MAGSDDSGGGRLGAATTVHLFAPDEEYVNGLTGGVKGRKAPLVRELVREAVRARQSATAAPAPATPAAAPPAFGAGGFTAEELARAVETVSAGADGAMTCERFQNSLASHLDMTMPVAEGVAFSRHAQECGLCRDILAEVSASSPEAAEDETAAASTIAGGALAAASVGAATLTEG